MLPVTIHPMTEREQFGTIGVEFLELLRTGESIRQPADPPDLRGYVELTLKGGFPEAVLERETARRDTWLDGYLSHMLNRDPSTLGVSPDSARLGRFFDAYALNTAGLATDTTLNNAAAINHRMEPPTRNCSAISALSRSCRRGTATGSRDSSKDANASWQTPACGRRRSVAASQL